MMRCLCALVFCVLAPCAHAQPSITDWSSAGGTPQNKSGAQDPMYLIQPGDALTFSVSATGTAPITYEWQVNKVVQTSATASFAWTVPSAQVTWEIQLRATNAGGEARKEWVVSTLSLAQAPALFDYFTDNALTARTETDPWGRPLPDWTVTGAWDAASSEARANAGTLSRASSVTRGTWNFRYRYLVAPPTTNYNQGLTARFIVEPNGNSLYLNNPTDGHWWVDYWRLQLGSWPRVPHAYPYVNMVGSQISSTRVAGTSWHSVTFVRDDDGYVGTWLDGTFVEWSRDRNVDVTSSQSVSFDPYGLTGQTCAIDAVEVYEGEIRIPNAGVSYNSATTTIVINDWDVTLQRIASAVDDPTVFAYEPATNTATSTVNLLVKSGAKFRIANGTLRMAGGRKLMHEREAMITLEGARIESADTASWSWELSGPAAYPALVLSVTDSALDNFGGFAASGVKSLLFENSRFTNLVGAAPFSLTSRRPPNGEFLIRGCLFQGKTGSETITFQGGDQFHQLRPEPRGIDIVDTAFENVRLFCRYDWPYYLSPGRPGGTANLVNTRVGPLDYSGSTYRSKYYLDVKVVDGQTPVPGATVTVTNEQDDANAPAENLLRRWEYLKVGDQVSAGGEDYFTGQQGNWFKGLVDADNHPSTVTGSDGYTPLPSDPSGTIVLTARKDTGTTVLSYSYTVTAEKDGRSATLAGLTLDETWYRSLPDVPPQTLVLDLGRGTGTVRPAVPRAGNVVGGGGGRGHRGGCGSVGLDLMLPLALLLLARRRRGRGL